MFEEGAQSAAEAASGFPAAPSRREVPAHPLLAGPLAAQACLAPGMASSGLSLSLAELHSALGDLDTLANLVEAFRLHLIPMLIARETGPRAPGSATTAWMSDHLRISRGKARADVDAARAVDPERGTLRSMGAALAEGEISREHVDVAVRALTHIPTGLVKARRAEIDAVLTDHARHRAPADAKMLAAHLVAALKPDGDDAPDDEPHQRRSLRVRSDATGMLALDGQLDPVGGAVVKTVLDHLADPTRTSTGEGGDDGQIAAEGSAPGDGSDPAEDTPRQRLADALVEMARLAQAMLAGENPHAEPAHVVVHCTPEQLAHPDPLDPEASCEPAEGGVERDGEACEGEEGEASEGEASQACEGEASEGEASEGEAGDDAEAEPAACLAPGAAHCEGLGAISARALHTLACDAIMERVVIDRYGKVLRLETLGRLASRAQRRALAARDGGCSWPGCSAPPSWCDAHHIVWWSRGGPTVIDNLTLLCQHHHTQIHREAWQITVREGVPWFIPPPWIDPAQVPRRNSLHAEIARTRQIGQRLLTGQPLDDLTHTERHHDDEAA